MIKILKKVSGGGGPVNLIYAPACNQYTIDIGKVDKDSLIIRPSLKNSR